jgi:hypothetical protein
MKLTLSSSIVLGSLNGKLEAALKKVSSLHAKNAFALAILTGDVFNAETDDQTVDSLLNGSYEFPLPTYFTIGDHPLPERIAAKIEADEEICPNLHFLGKRSITKTADGLRIVALGGQLDPNLLGGQSKEQHLPFHTQDDAKALKGANSADILLTSMWPTNIWNGSKAALEPDQKAKIPASESIAELCASLKPRYHLTASPDAFFYEREAFVHPTEGSGSNNDTILTTRFISMAPYGNEAKAKAMYAFTLNKSDDTVPPGATSSPFASRNKKRQQNSQDNDSFSRFSSHHDGGNHRGNRRKNRRQRSPPPGPDRCFFCLSNPNLAQHMCASIGDDAYITTAKGPLPTSTTFAEHNIPFPCHFLIIPLPHAPTLPSLGNASDISSDASKAHAEMTRFRESLQSMISAKSSRKLGAITWEISRDRNIHLIWQMMPLSAETITSGVAEAAFRVEAQNLEYPAFQTRELSLQEQAASETMCDFFRVWLWADSDEGDRIKSKSLVMPLASEMRFDLQFGRRVMAKLLGLEKRVIWQDCEQTVEEETADVERFRKAFEEWDFTL